MKLIGNPISKGFAIGKALFIEEDKLIIPHYISSFELEEARLGQAVQKYKLEISALKNRFPLFEAHLKILEEQNLLKNSLTKIKNESVNAEYALNFASKLNTTSFPDSIITEQVASKLLHFLLKIEEPSFDQLLGPVILIAEKWTPYQIVSMNPLKVSGLISEVEDKTLQTGRLASILGIPAVEGLVLNSAVISNGELLSLNGNTGEVLSGPTDVN